MVDNYIYNYRKNYRGDFMDSSAASAYVYSKASGMLSKSFVGQNAKTLFSVKSLRDLYSLLFSDEIPSIPETLLSKEIEEKAEKIFLEQYISLIKNFSKPAGILISLLNFYDYENLKSIAASLSLGERQKPKLTDTKDFSLLNYKAFPNLQKITENSELSWYNKIPLISEQQFYDSKLDSQYICKLYKSASELSGDIKNSVLKLIKAEISIKNILWVLRLKVYYKMSSDEIRSKLVFAEDSKRNGDVFAKEAVRLLDKDIGSFDDWKDWKYKDFLNPHEDGVVWEIDPAYVEKCFQRYLNKMAFQAFHKEPMSVLSLVAWFKVKQNELDNIRAVAEGLRLNFDSEKLMEAAGIFVKEK